MVAFSYATVPYYNALPLTHDLIRDPGHALYKLPPRDLVEVVRNGQVDCALMPVFGALKAGFYLYPECGIIGCEGRVESVGFIKRSHIKDLGDATSVDWGKESLSAAHLGLILLKYFWKNDRITNNIHKISECNTSDIQLVIGDEALTLARSNPAYIDLGEAWHDFTGHGFVFACWCSAKPLVHDVKKRLNEARLTGLSSLDSIIAAIDYPDRERLTTYLKKNITYTLSPQTQAGLELYKKYLVQEGLL